MLPLIILAGALAVAGGAGLYHLAKSSERQNVNENSMRNI